MFKLVLVNQVLWFIVHVCKNVIGILVGGYSISSGISLGGINPFELNQTSFCLSAQYINEMLAE